MVTKRNVAILGITILCLAPLLIDASFVSEIIREEWTKSKNFWGPMMQPASGERLNHRGRQIHHHCNHNERLKEIDHKATAENIRKNQNMMGSSSIELEGHKRATLAFDTLRVNFNTSRLQHASDSPYACYTTGASYTTSTGATAQCANADVLTTNQRQTLIGSVLPAAIRITSALLEVDRPPNNLFLDNLFYNGGNRDCAPGLPIPPSFLVGSVGIPNSDFYVWVTARPMSAGSLASARACNIRVLNPTGPRYGRPLAGHVNINPSGLVNVDFANSFDFERYVRIVLHELMHALGFSESMFPHYADDAGRFYTTTTVSAQIRNTTARYLTLPRVVQFAREHYNCSTLVGFELEDGGGSGTSGSHWELRLADNEIMSGYADATLQITNLTLSAFRDMGWYRVNGSMAEKFYLGHKQGCQFAQARCNTWRQPRTFCNSTAIRACSVDRKARGFCDFAVGQSIPAHFRYFADPTAGGRLLARDHCPVIEGFSTGYCQDKGYNALFSWEDFSDPDSRCFEIVESPGAAQTQGCLRHKCQGGILSLLLGDQWMPCTGTDLTFPGTSRKVICDPQFCLDAVETPSDQTSAAISSLLAPSIVILGGQIVLLGLLSLLGIVFSV